MSVPSNTHAHTAGPALRGGLWLAQGLLFLSFTGAGILKIVLPIPTLAAMIPWTGQHTEAFVRVIGVVDVLGGVGIFLPSVTRIRPGLALWAALGCAALQVSAIVFHVSRGEAALTPANFVFLGLALFVLWGRRAKAPIAPRP